MLHYTIYHLRSSYLLYYAMPCTRARPPPRCRAPGSPSAPSSRSLIILLIIVVVIIVLVLVLVLVLILILILIKAVVLHLVEGEAEEQRVRDGVEDRHEGPRNENAESTLKVNAKQIRNLIQNLPRNSMWNQPRNQKTDMKDLGGARCAELGGGWSTQSFSEIFGLLSSLLKYLSQRKAFRPALAEKSKDHRDMCLPSEWSGPLCIPTRGRNLDRRSPLQKTIEQYKIKTANHLAEYSTKFLEQYRRLKFGPKLRPNQRARLSLLSSLRTTRRWPRGWRPWRSRVL